MREVELYHHGIKGQKWGIRRFQNLDGTLTALGRRLASSDKVPQGIRDRARFALAKKSYDPSVVSLQKRRLGDQGQHLTRSQFGQPMFSPGFGEADPRHYITRHKNEPSVYGRNSYVGDPRFTTTRKSANEPERGFSTKPEDPALADARSRAESARANAPTFFTTSSGVKKERLSDKKEAAIAEAFKIRDSDEYQRRERELRAQYDYHRNKVAGDFGDDSKAGTFDQFVQERDKEHARQRDRVTTAALEDDRRTWKNGQMSLRERDRQEELHAVDRYNQRRAAAEAQRQRALQLQRGREEQIGRHEAVADSPFSRQMRSVTDRAANKALSGIDPNSFVKKADNGWSKPSSPLHSPSEVQRAMNFSSPAQKYSNRVNQAAAKSLGGINPDSFVKKADNGWSRPSTPLHSPSEVQRAMNSFSNPTKSPTYRQAVSRLRRVASQSVSSYASKARVNAGKAFTNYINRMSEAAKNIDADTWSF